MMPHIWCESFHRMEYLHDSTAIFLYLGHRFTASAIASIAFDKCVPVVDGNVCRVISRLKGVANNIKAPIFKDKIGWTLAEQIVTAGDGKYAGEVNQALMELGATLLK